MISFIYPYLEERKALFDLTLASLEAQTDKDFEVIKVNVTGTNPSQAQNEGVKKAKGDIIVLTSPEVVNAPTNVAEMKKLPDNTFWIGWVTEQEASTITSMAKESLKSHKEMRGFGAKCTDKTWADWKYFIGVIHKDDYLKAGGMDEEFMKGIAYEDRDFALRVKLAGIKAEFNPDIVGIHLSHSRAYQNTGDKERAINREYFFAKRKKLLGC